MSGSSTEAGVRAELARMLRDELAAPVPEPVRIAAEMARARHGEGIVAVLFYGSCRRDGWSPRSLIDLYLLAETYAAVHRGWLTRLANRLVPPNVYHLSAPSPSGLVQAKYAIVSLAQFVNRMRPQVRNPYFWARFAQPVGLVWARDADVRETIVAACLLAIETAWATARTLFPEADTPEELWPALFAATYATELRSEKPERAREIYLHDRARYDRIGELLRRLEPLPVPRSGRRRRELEGKILSLLRLAKAAFTFDGGSDYLAWKIERHSGVRVELGPFLRRHPLLAAAVLGLRLYRQRAFR
ncbi:hypothetical protein HRbin40_00925 [bacterium HR40]|nr:hypothetical protein HRbin40_00925 [bacterium HR40]